MKKLINEQLAITRTNPIKARLYDYPRFTYPWHFHSEYEFIFIEKGRGQCLAGDSIADYSEGDVVSGDLFISLDTVRSNAAEQGTDYTEELHRVIIHGILHLCGLNDKGPGERETMEAAENKALQTAPYREA